MNGTPEQDLSKQYDGFSEEFSSAIGNEANPNRVAFYTSLDHDLAGQELLDLACGNGADFMEYQRRGAVCHGIDASEHLVEEARRQFPHLEIKLGDMRSLPYPDNRFDIVTSKYALGTVAIPDEVFAEAARVLKPGGTFAYLTTHPFRLQLEQEDGGNDYFIQKDVPLRVFGDTFTIVEPSHTFEEFFSKTFLEYFDVTTYSEHYDPQSANHPGRDIYPDFFIVVATKR